MKNLEANQPGFTSERVLIENPKGTKKANAPINETGTASIGIRVVRKLPRKTNTTRSTSASASNNVTRTSLIDSLMNSVISMLMA